MSSNVKIKGNPIGVTLECINHLYIYFGALYFTKEMRKIHTACL